MEKITHSYMPLVVSCFLFSILLTIYPSTLARNLDDSSSQDQRTELTITFFMNNVLGNQNGQSFAGGPKVHGPRHSALKPISSFTPKDRIPVFNSNGGLTDPPTGWWPFLTSLQALEPGSLTEINEELTGNILLGPQLKGKVQGIFVTSFENNSSLMVALRAEFVGSEPNDSLRFFGLHQAILPESHIAVVGGTGKYHGANGYAVVKAISTEADSKGDGMKKVLSFTVHLKY